MNNVTLKTNLNHTYLCVLSNVVLMNEGEQTKELFVLQDGKQDWSSTTIIKTRLEPAFEASVAQN